jgi:hypothetical protein
MIDTTIITRFILPCTPTALDMFEENFGQQNGRSDGGGEACEAELDICSMHQTDSAISTLFCAAKPETIRATIPP